MNPLSRVVINRVAIVGGTHGNELTGLYLIKKFKQQPDLIQRCNFSTRILLANPEAIAAKTRYIDTDLNRCFERHNLENQTLTKHEELRAKTIDQTIGPCSNWPADFILDLHSTTANMGLTLIIDQEDAFVTSLASYLQQLNPFIKIYSSVRSGRNQDALRSLAKHGICLEVGPIAQSVLDASLFQHTENLVYTILNYLEQYNLSENAQPHRSLTLYRYLKTVDYPRDDQGNITAMIHPQLQYQDYQPLQTGAPLFLTFAGETISYQDSATVYPVFINEAAYYEKGIAFYLTQKEDIENNQFDSI